MRNRAFRLSIGFLLTVSWQSHPYYLGPDSVFAAAWVPLVLAGAGDDPRLVARRPDPAAHQHCHGTAVGPNRAGRLPHRAAALRGLRERPLPLPTRPTVHSPTVPTLRTPAIPDNATAETLDRRTLLRLAELAGMLVAGSAVTSAITAGIGRLLAGGGGGDPVAALPSARNPSTGSTSSNDSTSTNDAGGDTPTTTTDPSTGSSGTSATAAPSGVPIGLASAVPVGGVAAFSDPAAGLRGPARRRTVRRVQLGVPVRRLPGPILPQRRSSSAPATAPASTAPATFSKAPPNDPSTPSL